MINEHEKNLIYKLSKIFYRKFWENLIILFSTSIMVLIVFIVVFFNYLKETADIKTVIIIFCIFIVMLVTTIIGMKPFFKDLEFIKTEKFETIKGKVIKYRKVVHGGDPVTTSYFPTIRDINEEWIEVEVKANDTELNKKYYCMYLPNTKLAICEELKNVKEN